jgi:hypothetical protein
LWPARPGEERRLMSSATVQINVIPIRLLTMAEAARHCGRSLMRFKLECPVAPLKFANGDLRWDIQDLDAWINSLKAGAGNHDNDAIIARLGT